mmetsp:Transcript_46035/g.131407  ORF Transcript_46035/g.131407 Transcript_46035/m.131407 type:complete len:205 (-) Transcript_46035:1164-1778(-)
MVSTMPAPSRDCICSQWNCLTAVKLGEILRSGPRSLLSPTTEKCEAQDLLVSAAERESLELREEFFEPREVLEADRRASLPSIRSLPALSSRLVGCSMAVVGMKKCDRWKRSSLYWSWNRCIMTSPKISQTGAGQCLMLNSTTLSSISSPTKAMSTVSSTMPFQHQHLGSWPSSSTSHFQCITPRARKMPNMQLNLTQPMGNLA